MEDDGDLVESLIDFTQLGSIEDLMKNTATSDDIEAEQQAFDEGSGFEAEDAAFTANYTNEEDDQSYCDNILDYQQFVAAVDTPISTPADSVGDKKISAPKKMKKERCRWTEEEHRQMKRAFDDGYMGQWKKISELYIPTKTPIQITSHAQNYFRRKNNTNKKRKRKSIHDDIDDHHVHQQAAEVNSNTVNQYQQADQVVHDPSSSSMLNYPQSPGLPPPPGAGYDDDNVALYNYAHCYLVRLEEQKKMMMMMMLKYSGHDMTTMAPPGLLPGAGFSSNVSFGVNQLLQPYVGTSSCFATTAPAPHHDPYYYSAPLDDQWVLPQPLV